MRYQVSVGPLPFTSIEPRGSQTKSPLISSKVARNETREGPSSWRIR